MKTRIPDLSIERLDTDLVRLEQSDGMNESVIVDLHRLHVAHLAGMFGLAGTQEQELAIERLGDELLALRNGLARLCGVLAQTPAYPGGGTDDYDIAEELLARADRVLDRFNLAEPLPDASDGPANGPSATVGKTSTQLELTA